jgi:hypothetical protein
MGEAKRHRETIAALKNREPFFLGVHKIVEVFEFDGPLGGGIQSMPKALVAYQAIRSCDVDAAIGFGSMICRVGPHPRRDVIAWCGRNNSGEVYDGHFIGHCWIYHGDWIYDPSVGSWRDLDAQAAGMQVHDASLGSIQWTTSLPSYFFKPCIELEKPWRPAGTPELGQAWYGPLIYGDDGYDEDDADDAVRSVDEMVNLFAFLRREIGQHIADGVLRIKREFASLNGLELPEVEDNTPHPLKFRVRVGRGNNYIQIEQ